MNDVHRYFPEWADRPSGPDAQHESDRNSYLAGGYADEFGYDTARGWPPAITPLDGDPEGGSLWREQIGALHPGYPECPKPLDRFGREPWGAVSVQPRFGRAGRPATDAIQVIRVRSRQRVPRSHAALRLGVISYIAERLIRSRRLNDIL